MILQMVLITLILFGMPIFVWFTSHPLPVKLFTCIAFLGVANFLFTSNKSMKKGWKTAFLNFKKGYKEAFSYLT